MRVSTAITLALTALLTTSLVGAVVATPAVAVAASEQPRTDAVGEQPLLDPASTTLSQTTAPTPRFAAAQSGFDDTDPKQVIRINVSETGDATWTIESRFLFVDDDDEAFIDYTDEVRSGQRDITYDVERFDSFRQDAQQATGREMTLENAGWDEPQNVSPEDAGLDTIPETDDNSSIRVGVLAYSFTWTNFASIDDGLIYFGDAFQTDADSWFSLTEGQRLVIESPSGYAVSAQGSTTLQREGPYQFSEGDFPIIFVPSAGAGGGNGGVPTPAIPDWLVAGVFALVVAVGVGSYLLARRRPVSDLPLPIAHLRERVVTLPLVRRLDVSTSNEQARNESVPTDGGSIESPPERADPIGAVASTGSGMELEYDETIDDGIDPELLSDEERVLRLLKQNNGRMKQGSIVSETGWSNAKVSQLLSQMDEDGEIEKLRIGRENLITLPDVDPTEVN